MSSRLERLLIEVREAANASPWHKGVPGLTLDIEYLQVLGASPQFLLWWSEGTPVNAEVAPLRKVGNHPSL